MKIFQDKIASELTRLGGNPKLEAVVEALVVKPTSTK
jgi:hypothetical protein